MVKLKLILSLGLLLATLVFLGGQLSGSNIDYLSVLRLEPAEAAPAPVVPQFHRGYTNKQDQPCWNEHTKGYYESELITKNETAHYLLKAGASVEQADILSAISHAESGSQINCWGDDSDQYYGQPTNDGRHWGESYGLFQIRTIIEASGTGECRDVERLRLNIEQQAICAWELSAQGRVYSPTWSMYTNGRYREWLGKDW